MFINKWLNNSELKLSDIRIGSLLSQCYNTVIITGIHLSGKIEFSDYYTNQISVVETLSELSPFKLPEGANVTILEFYLKNTSFIQVKPGHFTMIYEGNDIDLYQKLLTDRWEVLYNSNDTKIYYPLFFYHELQNIFQLITNQKLKL